MVEKFLKELEVLVNIDSGLGAPEGADRVGELLSHPLVERGWLLEKHKVSDACGSCFVLKNREAQHYDVLMIGHIDTVFPAGEALRRPFTRDEKRAYGVGVLDMKQGCLAMVWVLKALYDVRHGAQRKDPGPVRAGKGDHRRYGLPLHPEETRRFVGRKPYCRLRLCDPGRFGSHRRFRPFGG